MQYIILKSTFWYEQQPFFTKTYTLISLTLSLMLSFDLISSFHLFYTFEDTFYHLNFWRPFTGMVFLGKINLLTLLNCLTMFLVLNNLQKDKFCKKTYPDFIWLIIVMFTSCILAGSLFNLYFLAETFISSLMPVCAYQKQKITVFGKSITLKLSFGMLFVFVYALLMALIQKRRVTYFIGVVIGLIYIFLKHKLSKIIGRDCLATPSWLENWWLHSALREQAVSS